jgi:hypothetical protein
MGEMSMPHEREPFARSLKDYAEDYQWIRLLDWPDEDLARVQVHEEPDSSQELIDLANFGGTRLSVSDADIATSADVNLGVHNLYAYRGTTPPVLWERLQALIRDGGPAGLDPVGAFEQD